MNKSAQARIDDLFLTASASTPGSVEFPKLAKLLWPVLDNKVSLVDLAGLFTMSVPTHVQSESIDNALFFDVVNAVAKLKYPTGKEFCDKFLDELKVCKPLHSGDNSFFDKCMDKSVIKSLLRFDIPIRRVYSNFAGKSVSAGGGVTWEEVKRLNLALELDGFLSLGGSFSIIPGMLESRTCESLFRDAGVKYPLHVLSGSLGSILLFPQFQMLLCMTAFEIHRQKMVAERVKTNKEKFKEELFAKKLLEDSEISLGDIVAEFLKDIGIDKTDKSPLFFSATASLLTAPPPATLVVPSSIDSPTPVGSEISSPVPGKESAKLPDPIYMSPEKLQQIGAASTTGPATPSLTKSLAASTDSLGLVSMPLPVNPQDKLFPTSNHSRQAMLMRMDHLMDEVETAMLQLMGAGSDVLAILSAPVEENTEARSRPLSKPVVIADAVPVPEQCPESVEQLLEAALAHHNLGGYQESLKFLEAARLQMEDIKKRATAGDLKCILPVAVTQNIHMYISVCKGNVYQSSGDDEQSMLQYMDGWYAAQAVSNHDWEIVFLNCIGMLAYYNLRYDVGLMCFSSVVKYRHSAYGADHADTASSVNNEACCLYCLHKRAEARVRFERAWNALCHALGHRSPRSVAVWKNLEKARRAHGSMGGMKNMKDTVEMRPDASKLLFGGDFYIKAFVPSDGKKKKKKGGGKKKK